MYVGNILWNAHFVMISVMSSILSPLLVVVSSKWFKRSSVTSHRTGVRLPTLLGITCLPMAERILFQSSPCLQCKYIIKFYLKQNNLRKNQPWRPVAMLVNVGNSVLKHRATRRILSLCSEHCFHCICAIHKHSPTKTCGWKCNVHGDNLLITFHTTLRCSSNATKTPSLYS